MSRKATLAVVAIIGLSALAASGQIFAADPDTTPRSAAMAGKGTDVAPESRGSYLQDLGTLSRPR